MELAQIYVRLLVARARAQLQYRVSFWLQVAGSFCLTFIDFLVVLVIFSHLPYLAGWSLGEVAFLYSTSYVTFQVTDLFIGQLDQLPALIQRGDFDLILIRPLGALFQVLTLDITLRKLGGIAQGAVVLVVALRLVHIDWTAGRIAMLLSVPLTGGVIFGAVWVAGAATVFWTVRAMEAINAFTYGGQLLTSYPMDLYGTWLRRLFIFVVPLAFVNYFPALYILQKQDSFGAPSELRFLGPPVALVLVLLVRPLWQLAVRHYRSTGS